MSYIKIVNGVEVPLTAEEVIEFEAKAAAHEVAKPVVKVPKSITRRQAALQLLAMGQITAHEALDMAKTAAVPGAISTIFADKVANGNWTPEQKIIAEIDFASTNYYRENSLLALMGLTSEQTDQFFIGAAIL
jgi:hypothetical protein